MSRLLRRFGSVRVAAVLLALLFFTVVACRAAGDRYDLVAIPLTALAVQILVALRVNAGMRRSPTLALFHAVLPALCAAAVFSVLMRFEGRIEVVEGFAPDPADTEPVAAGLLARRHWRGEPFRQADVHVDYAPGLVRLRTRTSVRTSGGLREVNDLQTIDHDGFHFRPTPNKGFALLLTWQGNDGSEVSGAVHLPSFPALEWRQENRWETPAGEQVILGLNGVRAPMDQPWVMERGMGLGPVELQSSQRRQTLRAGEWTELRGGRLRLDTVRIWMGYRIVRDPALPWLFGLALGAVMALVAHVSGLRRLPGWRPRVSGRTSDVLASR